MPNPSLLDMLQHGVHFGHQQSRRHPKMEPYIFGTRSGVSIIDLEKTRQALTQATAFVRDLVAAGGVVVFVGTKRQARSIVQAAAQQAAMPYVVDRWIGGLFTNFNHVRELIRTMHQLKEDRVSGGWNKYTKKEQVALEKELARLEKLVGGLSNLDKLPAAVFVIDIKTDKTAVHEAQKVNVPVVAMCDTNTNPTGITYPVPANDDATKSIQLMCQAMAEAVQAGRELADQRLTAQAKAAAEAAAASQEQPA